MPIEKFLSRGVHEIYLSAEVKKASFAKREFFRTLGLDIDTVASPETAPKVVDFAKFWNQTGCKDQKIVVPRDHEIYVGVDYKPRKGVLEVCEITNGEQYSVTPERPHFIEMHSEPDFPDITNPIEELHDNLPNPHFEDMSDFLSDDRIFCSIIIRMIDDGTVGVFLAFKTDIFDNSRTPLLQSSEVLSRERKMIESTLENDDVLITKNGVAVYRGFVELPPKRGRSYLRLRKPD